MFRLNNRIKRPYGLDRCDVAKECLADVFYIVHEIAPEQEKKFRLPKIKLTYRRTGLLAANDVCNKCCLTYDQPPVVNI